METELAEFRVLTSVVKLKKPQSFVGSPIIEIPKNNLLYFSKKDSLFPLFFFVIN